MLIAAALLIQTTLIVWLYYEHHRRRNAEADSRKALAKFADMNWVATAGELTASIAHEIKQPLAHRLVHRTCLLLTQSGQGCLCDPFRTVCYFS